MEKLRGILEKLWDDGYCNGRQPEPFGIDKAEQAILALLPEKMNKTITFDNSEILIKSGYNQALDDMREALGGGKAAIRAEMERRL